MGDLTEINFLNEHRIILLIILTVIAFVPDIMKWVMINKRQHFNGHYKNCKRSKTRGESVLKTVANVNTDPTFKDLVRTLDSLNYDCKMLLKKTRSAESKFEKEMHTSESWLLEMKQDIKRSVSLQDDYLFVRKRELQRLMDNIQRNKLYDNDFVRQQIQRHGTFVNHLLCDDNDNKSPTETSRDGTTSLSTDASNETLESSDFKKVNSLHDYGESKRVSRFGSTIAQRPGDIKQDVSASSQDTLHKYSSLGKGTGLMYGQGDTADFVLQGKRVKPTSRSLSKSCNVSPEHKSQQQEMPSILKNYARSDGCNRMLNFTEGLMKRSSSEKNVRFAKKVSIHDVAAKKKILFEV